MILSGKKSRTPMPLGNDALNRLRSRPEATMEQWGFVVRGLNRNFFGKCTVVCRPYQESPSGGQASLETNVYQLDVMQDGEDWYFPYQHGHAGNCLVPFGQPPGTLVLTHGMNGCALDVREEVDGNRFFHDADGRFIGVGSRGKFRANYEFYAGKGDTTRLLTLDLVNADKGTVGNFEHTLICVKQADSWCVLASAVVSYTEVNSNSFHVLVNRDHRVPTSLGSFPDKV